MTDLVEPVDFGFVDCKHGSGTHDQTSEGKADRC